jgi:hypothetical protein
METHLVVTEFMVMLTEVVSLLGGSVLGTWSTGYLANTNLEGLFQVYVRGLHM